RPPKRLLLFRGADSGACPRDGPTESVENGTRQKPLFLERGEARRCNALRGVLLPAPPVEHHRPPHRELSLLFGSPAVVVLEQRDGVPQLVRQRAHRARPSRPVT